MTAREWLQCNCCGEVVEHLGPVRPWSCAWCGRNGNWTSIQNWDAGEVSAEAQKEVSHEQ